MPLVQTVTIDTQLTPEISIDLASGQSSGSSWIMNLVKPRITVQTEIGSKTVAPWGDPAANYWPMIEFAALTLAAYAVWRISR